MWRYDRMEPLNPRNAFFSGRSRNNIKIYDCEVNEEIRYVDVCSLYSSINNRGEYVFGHLKIYTLAKEKVSSLLEMKKTFLTSLG